MLVLFYYFIILVVIFTITLWMLLLLDCFFIAVGMLFHSYSSITFLAF